MRLPLPCLVLPFLVACGSPAKDMDAICAEHTAAKAGTGDYAGLSGDKLQITLARNITGKVSSSEIKAALATMSAAPPEQRYQLWQNAAREAGVEGWSCPAME